MSTRPKIGREHRVVSLADVEFREAEDGGSLTFRGYAAVFGAEVELSDFFGSFRERIAPGAFAKTINDGSDVRFLFNHDPDSVMARTTNGTLRLHEDDYGLRVEADLDPSDFDVSRLAPKLRSKNVSQMSFGFRVVKEEWDEDGDPPLRTLKEVQLFDVSPVTFPAYPQTAADIRDALAYAARFVDFGAASVPPQLAIAALKELPADAGVNPDVRVAIERLADTLRAEPDPEPQEEHSGHSLDAFAKRVAIQRQWLRAQKEKQR